MSERIRDELARRAGSVDVSPAARERVLGGVRPRRRWVPPALGAAAAVAVTIVGLSVLGHDPEPPAPVPASVEPIIPGGWRDEAWRNLTVSVPGDWGYGVAPTAQGLMCGGPSSVAGYVGRPVGLSDACSTYRPGRLPTPAPYVWLGADLDPGVTELFGGVTQETVERFGTTLTVATHDPALRARILDSARETSRCAAVLDTPPDPEMSDGTEGAVFEGGPDQMEVCAYRRDKTEEPIGLVYSAQADDAVARTWAAMTEGRRSQLRCTSSDPGNEWVVLRFTGPDAFGDGDVQREVVLHLSGSTCPRVQWDPATAYVLTPDMVGPWATDGVNHTIYGPSGGKGAMLDAFIPGWV